MTRSTNLEIPKRKFTVEEYHQLREVGILKAKDRVELIQGEIIEMSPIGPKHAGNIDRLVRILNFLLGEKGIARGQNPIRLNDLSEPEPDIAIVDYREDFYTSHHPAAKEVRILIEYADSSLNYDRNFKLPHYAASGIPEVWIVDLEADQVLVHTEPQDGQYLDIKAYKKGDVISSPWLPKPIEVTSVLF